MRDVIRSVHHSSIIDCRPCHAGDTDKGDVRPSRPLFLSLSNRLPSPHAYSLHIVVDFQSIPGPRPRSGQPGSTGGTAAVMLTHQFWLDSSLRRHHPHLVVLPRPPPSSRPHGRPPHPSLSGLYTMVLSYSPPLSSSSSPLPSSCHRVGHRPRRYSIPILALIPPILALALAVSAIAPSSLSPLFSPSLSARRPLPLPSTRLIMALAPRVTRPAGVASRPVDFDCLFFASIPGLLTRPEYVRLTTFSLHT